MGVFLSKKKTTREKKKQIIMNCVKTVMVLPNAILSPLLGVPPIATVIVKAGQELTVVKYARLT